MKQSELEQSLLTQIINSGLPAPHTEFRFNPPRRWRCDFAFTLHRIAVEVEGGTWVFGRHQRGQGFEDDCVKYNELAIGGWLLIRVTAAMVKDGRALTAIHRAFAERRVKWIEPNSEGFLAGFDHEV